MPNQVSKEEWIALFRELGLTDEAMMKWHRLFEARHPQGHEDFLAWLGLDGQEIALIRAASK
jgi:hypothetical protein